VSLRDKILEAKDIQVEMVEIPEWDVTVEVRGMSGADRALIYSALSSEGGGDINAAELFAETVIATAYDPETGARVFEPGDKTALMEKSAQAVDRVAKVGLRLSGMEGEASQDAAGKSVSSES
jgi:hypothetical protein